MENKDATFRDILLRLAAQEQPFPAKYLHYFSDLTEEQSALFANIWKELTNTKRISILEDLDELSEHDTLMDFSSVGKLALNDHDEGVRETALHLLWELEEKSFILTVIELLIIDPSARVRASAASLMGRFVYLGETDELSEHLNNRVIEALLNTHKNDTEKLVKRHALESLGYSSRGEITHLITQACTSKDHEWMTSSLYAMGRSADPSWSEIILKHFDHPEDIVREEAVRAAGELELTHTREKLLNILENEENDDVRAASIWSLSQIGGEGVREAITKQTENIQDEELLIFIEDALDNLNFTEELSQFDLLDINNKETDE